MDKNLCAYLHVLTDGLTAGDFTLLEFHFERLTYQTQAQIIPFLRLQQNMSIDFNRTDMPQCMYIFWTTSDIVEINLALGCYLHTQNIPSMNIFLNKTSADYIAQWASDLGVVEKAYAIVAQTLACSGIQVKMA